MKRVIIESPYAGDVERNTAYARACLLDSLKRGEAPIASHLLHTQVLEDTDPDDRRLGIDAGLAWYDAAHSIVFCVDLGMSAGMKMAGALANERRLRIETRRLGGEWAEIAKGMKR